jgi:hypothetical protein
MILDETSAIDSAECAVQETQESSKGLFSGDTGELSLETRRAFIHLLAGPFISGAKHSRLWNTLIRDEKIIQIRLSELFLTLIIDRDQQVAFVKQAEVHGIDAPSLLRRSQLTFIDSALILHLRRRLAHADANAERAVISSSEIIEHLSVYERSASTDRSGYIKRVNASIEKLKKNNVLQLIRSTKDRYEISPTLKLLFSAAEITALTNLYRQLAESETSQLINRRKKVSTEKDTESDQTDDDE